MAKKKDSPEGMIMISRKFPYKSGIRPMLGGDKKKAIAFDNGESVEVTKEQFDNISKLGWCKQDGYKKTQNTTEDRDNPEG